MKTANEILISHLTNEDCRRTLCETRDRIVSAMQEYADQARQEERERHKEIVGMCLYLLKDVSPGGRAGLRSALKEAGYAIKGQP